jgi:hypothetical protein
VKNFNTWLNRCPKIFRDTATAMHDYLKPYSTPGGIAMPFHQLEAEKLRPTNVPLDAWRHVVKSFVSTGDSWGVMDLWAFAGFYRDGIRAYCPTVTEVEALSMVEMRVPWSAYRQPFPTMSVIIPDGLWSGAGSNANLGRPIAVIIRHDPVTNIIAAVVPMIDADGRDTDHLSAHYAARVDDPRTIEEYIADLPDDPSLSPTEDKFLNRLIRIAINANLLLTHKGAKPLGYANPGFADRLKKLLTKTRLPQSARAANEDALRMVPLLYGFDQHVRVYEHDSATTDSGNNGGWSVKPHWRRGHWANHPCGVGRTERRLVFRPAVLVNPHLLAGPVSNTRVTITTPGISMNRCES